MKWSSEKSYGIIRMVNSPFALSNWQECCCFSCFCMLPSCKTLKMKDSPQTYLWKATMKKDSAFKRCSSLKWRRKLLFMHLWVWCNCREKSRKWARFYNFLRELAGLASFESSILLHCSFIKICLRRIFHFECFARWEHAKTRKTATFLTIRKRKRWVNHSYDFIRFFAVSFHQ